MVIIKLFYFTYLFYFSYTQNFFLIILQMLGLKNTTYLVFALSHITQKKIQKEQCHTISSIAHTRSGFIFLKALF